MPKQKTVKVKKVKTMSKLTKDKVGRKMFRPIDLFNHMTDEDFMMVHRAGQLKQLCVQLSLDLQPTNDGESNTYAA